MVVDHSRRIIFVHIPKTGGSSVEAFLGLFNVRRADVLFGVVGSKALQHLTYNQIKDRVKLADDYYSLSIVRNPYTRFISEYYWCEIKGKGYKSGQTVNQFIDYVAEVVENQQFTQTVYSDHFIPQYRFIMQDGRLQISKLIYFENLREAFDLLKEKYGIEKTIPHIHSGSRTKLTLSDFQKEQIYQIYELDFKYFGYDK